ncbi:MAG TPA: helix-turn-helix domain-containing protein [Acidimicrobiia bacterium]|nr:helix-turn-helix domain-containing protein [Acidimicrobiia bacterium]
MSDERQRRAQLQAKALGDPTRHAIFRAVADAAGPVDVATLTARFELNHNAIRQHLAKLCAAGLVVEEVAPSRGPGRPRLQYRPALVTSDHWAIPSPYEHLSVMLVEALRTGRSPREVGAEAGRELAATLPDTEDPVERLEILAARRGFEPRRVERRETVDLVLDHCPFRATATTAPEIVCQLHLGLAEGIAEASGETVQVTELVARDPRRAGCRLKLKYAAG